MKATLKKLITERFRGWTATIEFHPDGTIIRATNKGRKTTTNSAISWCMTGTDVFDRTNFKLYDENVPFDRENSQTASSEVVWDIDGVERSFKRVAKQKWEYDKSHSEYRKAKADDYTYYVDGLAVPAKTFKEVIEGIFGPIDKLKLMLNPRYYLYLDWKVLRKHFSDMVGIIDESELKGDYSKIADLLKLHKTNDAVKVKLKQQLEPIVKEINTIDMKIKGQKETLPDLDGVEDAKIQIADKKKRIAEIDKEILGLGEANKPFVEKRNGELKVIADKKIELELGAKRWESDQLCERLNIESEIQHINTENEKIRKENDRIAQQRKSLQSQLDIAKQQYQFYSEERDRLAEEKDKAKSFAFNENQVCATCGQPLPYDKVEKIREKFYTDRDAKVKTIIEKGVRARDNRDAQNDLAKDLEKQISELPEAKSLLDLAELEAQLALAKSNVVHFEQSDIYAQLTKDIADMETNLTVVPEVDSAELVAEKTILTSEIGELQKIVAKESQYNDIKSKIEKNEASKSPLGVERGRLDGLLRVCIERDREYASIVRDRANKYLEYAQVEMIELNKGGDVTDICKLSARNVSADVQNNETQINIGVDVARAFQKNLGVNLPILIDNMEGITDDNIPDVDNQLILFYVDSLCPKLTTFSKAEWQSEQNRRVKVLAERFKD